MLKARLSDAQMSALECSGALEDIGVYLPAILDGQVLIFDETARDSLASQICDLSNAEDAFAEIPEHDGKMRKHAARAARSLAALQGKVLRA